MRQKIALICNLYEQDVIPFEDVAHIYELPLALHAEGVDDRICEKLGIWAGRASLDKWVDLVSRLRNPAMSVKIGVVGKYVHLTDTYKSLNEALYHGGLAHAVKVELVFVDSETIDTENPRPALGSVDGVLVPGGFGERGTEGKIAAIRWARENDVPFFGICLGLQLAVVEYARTVCGLHGAMSREFDADPTHPVIDFMDEQRHVVDKGGTMRLGSFPCELFEGTLARRIYGEATIDERHRHRLELSPAYHQQLIDAGLIISGMSPDRVLAEVIELENHPWFLGCQFHPEFKSRPLDPHPLFASYIKAVAQQKRVRQADKSGDVIPVALAEDPSVLGGVTPEA
jgi:CTP synthase